MPAGNSARPQKPAASVAQPAPAAPAAAARKSPLPSAPRSGPKPKPAEDGDFQRTLVSDLVGMGFLSVALEAAEHADSMSGNGMSSGEDDQPVAISPSAAIDPGRRFVPR